MTSEVVVQERNKTMEIFFNIGWLIWQEGKLYNRYSGPRPRTEA